MEYSLVDQSNWNAFCDYISRSMRGRRVEIETESLDCRERINQPTVRIFGLAYSAERDELLIQLENTTPHVISEPRYIVLGEHPVSVESISVLDSSNHLQIIAFKNSLFLGTTPAAAIRQQAVEARPS